MKKPYSAFILDQFTILPAVEKADLTGKTVIVVGANTGIGFEAATHFARMNPAKLILACRSASKGNDAASAIRSATGFEGCEPWTVDLGDFASVVRFAERFHRECDRLDILVMNAGMLSVEYTESVDGWESSLQVNHLGTALLSLLLLPRLVDTGNKFGSTSRLVIVASEVHYWAVLPNDVRQSLNPVARLSSPDYRDPASMRRRYLDTKLLNVLFSRALQERLKASSLIVNSVNPGLCRSNLARNLPGPRWNLTTLRLFLLARSAEKGSRQLIYAAVGGRDEEDEMRGAYVTNASVDEPSDFVISDEGKRMQDVLWRETVEILSEKAPQLRSIVQAYLA